MVGIISKPDTQEKLEILSADSQYDLACACGTSKDEHRKRSGDGKWIYPVTLPSGGTSVLFKTLLSNVCTNDCKYCPLREQMDVRRCSLTPDETVKVFLDYYNQQKVFGLFLSSGVIGSPDATMDRLNGVARLLRYKHRFKGYIHLKIIPGAGNAGLIERWGLTEFLLDRFAIAGTPGDCVAQIRRAMAAGAHQFVITGFVPDPRAFMRRWMRDIAAAVN